MMTQNFLGLGGSRIPVPQAAVDGELRAALEGDSLDRAHPGYADARRIWNAMIDRRPALIACCANAADVQRCVRFARAHGLALTVRGGGHNIGGRSLAEDALLVDFSRDRRVRVRADEALADMAPGALLGDVDRATKEHALVLPTGIVSETGVAGLTLGGGFGWLSRRFGLTCDHLVEAEVITGSGDLVRASEQEHGDLLWALRGGGGGFGIVTNFRFRLQRFEPQVLAGPLFRESEHTEEVFERFRRLTANAPEALTCLLKLGAAPPAPFLPESLHGKPVGITIVCHSGAPESAAQDLAELRREPAPVADLIQPRPFADFQAMFDAGEPKGRRDYWKSEYVSALDDETARILLDAIEALPSPHSNIKIFQLGGAVSRVEPSASAAGHRDARFIIVVASAWENTADDARNIGWVRDTWSRVHARSGRGGYVNFLTEDTSAEERARAYGGVDLDRLAAIRRRYDPDGLFAVA